MAFFVDAEDCGMSKDAMSEDMAENSCCSQDIVYVDGLDDLKASYDDLSVDQKTFLTVFTSSYFDLLFVPKERIIPLEQYPPHLLVKDIQLIDQVFLIWFKFQYVVSASDTLWILACFPFRRNWI